MRCYTQPHQCYGGIDLHARTMEVGILHPAGESVGPRHGKARPEALHQRIAPSRAALVIAVACLLT